MGSCATISKNRKAKKCFSSQPLHVFFPSSSRIYKLKTSMQLEITPVKFPEALPSDTAYTFVQPDLVFLAGGSNSSSSLRNEVFQVSLNSKTLEYLPNFPIPSKCGDLHYYKSNLYYIGGVRLYNNEDLPTPFIRQTEGKTTWELLEETSRVGKHISVTNQLFRPGSYLLNSSIFLIGGEVKIPNYTPHYSKNVYKFDLDSLTITRLDYKSPNCIAPKCFQSDYNILILGSTREISNFFQVLGPEAKPASPLGFHIKNHLKVQWFDQSVSLMTKKKVHTFKEKKNVWISESLDFARSVEHDIIDNIMNEKPRTEVPSKVLIVSKYYEDTEENSREEVNYVN